MQDGSLNRIALSTFIAKDGRSVRKIAEAAGISGSYLGKLIKGVKPMKLAVALRIANVLGVPIAAFFTIDSVLSSQIDVIQSGGVRAS